MADYTSPRRRQNRRKYKVTGRPAWPYIMALLIVATVVIAVSARKCVARDNPATRDLDAPGHIADLDIAEYAPGNPEANHSIVKRYEGFTVGFNRSNRTPDWVGWELLVSEADGTESRSDRFWQDWALDGCPSPDDYRRSGFDKGHLCPAADQKWSANAMSDCFVMANMAPQDHALNAGAWKTLEEKERIWARRDSALVIVAGTIYSDSDRTMIGNGVRVPSAFYKVLLAPYIDRPRAIGFVYPNMKSPGNMSDYAMPVDEVERLTGLDFFSNLPDDLEERIEKTSDFKIWNRR